jgi:hypothetical protein
MPTYEIDQYEYCTVTYRVIAPDEAEAVRKLHFTWDWVRVPLSIELEEINEDRGIPAKVYPTLARKLRELEIDGVDEVIPGIAHIREVPAEDVLLSPPPKLCLVLESEPHGRESFDHYVDIHEMLAALYRLLISASGFVARDGIERIVGIAISPGSESKDTADEVDHHSAG